MRLQRPDQHERRAGGAGRWWGVVASLRSKPGPGVARFIAGAAVVTACACARGFDVAPQSLELADAGTSLTDQRPASNLRVRPSVVIDAGGVGIRAVDAGRYIEAGRASDARRTAWLVDHLLSAQCKVTASLSAARSARRFGVAQDELGPRSSVVATFDIQRASCTRLAFDTVPIRGNEQLLHALLRGYGLRARAPPSAVGTLFELEVRLRPTIRFENVFDALPWPRAAEPVRGVIVAARVARQAPFPSRVLFALRQRLAAGIARSLTEPTRGVVLALVLGDAGAVEVEAQSRIRDAGLSHVLAVSGAHITLVSSMFVVLVRTILRRTRLARSRDVARIASLSGIPIAMFYAELTGSQPSSVRAALMASLVWGLRFTDRTPVLARVLIAVALALVIIRPADALDAGFWLSVLATGAVLVATGSGGIVESGTAPNRSLTSRWAGFGRTLARFAEATTRAAFVAVPVCAWCFESFTSASIVANLALATFGGIVLLPLGLLHATLAMGGVELLVPLLDVSVRLLLHGADWFAQVFPPIPLAPLSLASLLGIAIIGLTVGLGRWTSTRMWMLLGCGVALAVGSEVRTRRLLRDGKLRMTFVDVGQGDATLITTPNGRHILIDTGGDTRVPSTRALLRSLRAARVGTLDLIVVTHSHPDHTAGLQAVKKETGVAEVWTNTEHPPSGRTIDGVRFEILGPTSWRGAREYDFGESENDNSIVLRVSTKLRGRAIVALFLGDIEHRAERRLLRAAGADALRADVVKVPHHGSRTSSGAELVRASAPRFAFMGVGRPSPFSHPHPSVFARWTESGALVRSTAADGGCVLALDADGSDLTCALSGRRSWRRKASRPN